MSDKYIIHVAAAGLELVLKLVQLSLLVAKLKVKDM